MTENPKEKSQSDLRYEKLSKELAEIKELFLKPLIEPKTISHEEHEKPTISHLSLADLEKTDCPTCKKALDEFGNKFHKKFVEERKENPYECENCGTRVKIEEENCPTCGNNKARKRD